ncbi:acyl-CoA thioesterase [Chitinophagaceae bacterium LWZ2-11]
MLQVRRPAFTVLTMLSWNEADSRLMYILLLQDNHLLPKLLSTYSFFLPPFYKNIVRFSKRAWALCIHTDTKQTSIKMTLEERIEASETHIFKAVFPNTTNHYDTLFGGTALHLMDEVAFIAATRFSRQRVVTVSSDKIDFTKPIPAGTLIELIGRVTHVGNTSMKVQVEIYIEQMYSTHREKAISGSFTFVAVDEHKKPLKILKDND